MLDAIKSCVKNHVTWSMTAAKGVGQVLNGDIVTGWKTFNTGIYDGLTFGLFSEVKNKVKEEFAKENKETNMETTIAVANQRITELESKLAELQKNEKEGEKQSHPKLDEKPVEISAKPHVIPYEKMPQNLKKILADENYLKGIQQEAFARIDGKGNKDGKVTTDEALKDLQDMVLSEMKDKEALSANIKDVLKKYAGADRTFSAEEWALFLNGKEWDDILNKYHTQQAIPDDRIPSKEEIENAIVEC